METIYNEVNLVSQLYGEYLSALNRYHNTKRGGCFVKYFNINYDEVTYHPTVESTYDIYTYSDVQFDIFDYTPAFYVGAISNQSSNVQDLKGQLMDGTSTVTVYTLSRPRIHDIVTFYDPIKSGEIFRVTNIRSPINAIRSGPTATWYELDIEYAPIKSTAGLKLLSHYYYDLSKQKYIIRDEYLARLDYYAAIETLFESLVGFYDPIADLYRFGDLIPVAVNELVIFFKRMYNVDFRRIFEKLKSPFGYIDRFGMTYSGMATLPFSDPETTTYLARFDNGDLTSYLADRNVWQEPYTLDYLIYLGDSIYRQYKTFITTYGES